MSEDSLYQKIRNWFRFYFIRQKSPLSYIWWKDILHRDTSSEGMYGICIATTTPDCAISLSSGSPKENVMEICVYDSNNKLLETIKVKLPYRSKLKIKEGFNKAWAVSRASLKKEKASRDNLKKGL